MKQIFSLYEVNATIWMELFDLNWFFLQYEDNFSCDLKIIGCLKPFFSWAQFSVSSEWFDLIWSKYFSFITNIWNYFFRNPLSETPICNWGEFFVLYKDNISCDMRRYPQHKVKFHIWSKILGRYRVNRKRNVRFKAIFYFKISDFNRICNAIWFKFCDFN